MHTEQNIWRLFSFRRREMERRRDLRVGKIVSLETHSGSLETSRKTIRFSEIEYFPGGGSDT